MVVRFTRIRLSGGSTHEHITHLRGVEDASSATYESTRSEWVGWIESGGSGYVGDRSGNRAQVVVVQPTIGPKYLRTVANNRYTDNLLSLPRF